MIKTVFNIITIFICTGGISFAVYDMITGKITRDEKTGRKVMFYLYLILIIVGVKIILEKIDLLT